MGSEFTFYDYVDGNGVNIVDAWLRGIPTGAKQKFDRRLFHLEGTPPGQWGSGSRLVDTLTDYCVGLFEVRVPLAGQQYRILGARSGREPMLLHCFVKSGSKVPKVECDRAFEKMAAFEADPANHRVEHRYDQI